MTVEELQQAAQNNSSGNTAPATSGYMAPYPPYGTQPCPHCGHCPTCGRGGHYVAPYIGYPMTTTYTGNGSTSGIAQGIAQNPQNF